MPRGRRIPQLHDAAWLRSQLEVGRSQCEIAEEIGCNQSSISHALERLGLDDFRHVHRHPEQLDDADWLRQQIEAGGTPPSIAAVIGCSPSAVYAACDRLGVERKRLPPISAGPLYERAAEIADMGLSNPQMEVLFGLSKMQARYVFNRLGLHERWKAARAANMQATKIAAAEERRRWREENRRPPKYPLLRDPDALVEALRERSLTEVATMIGCDPSSVFRALQRKGIEFPDGPGRKYGPKKKEMADA